MFETPSLHKPDKYSPFPTVVPDLPTFLWKLQVYQLPPRYPTKTSIVFKDIGKEKELFKLLRTILFLNEEKLDFQTPSSTKSSKK